MPLLAEERRPRQLVCYTIVRKTDDEHKVVIDCAPRDRVVRNLVKLSSRGAVGGCLVFIEKDEDGRVQVRSYCNSIDRLLKKLS